MSWLKKLLGGGEAKAPAPAPAAPAVATREREPVVIPETPANPVQALLDDIGAPWRLPRAELEARFGITVDPAYDWEVIQLRTKRPLVEDLIRPLTVHTAGDLSPRMPAAWFSATAWSGEDARANLARVVAQLEPILGPPSIGGPAVNTVHCEWRFGPASVALNVWPADLQDGADYEVPAHVIEPRLASACGITIETGFKPGLSARERGWLDAYSPLATLPPDLCATLEEMLEEPAANNELEFVREPPADVARLFGTVGVAGDREALIICQRHLYVIDARDIVGFRVIRILPAKGGGCSRLEVECRLYDEETTSIGIAQSGGADDLTALGEQLAAAIGARVEICPYDYDV